MITYVYIGLIYSAINLVSMLFSGKRRVENFKTKMNREPTHTEVFLGQGLLLMSTFFFWPVYAMLEVLYILVLIFGVKTAEKP